MRVVECLVILRTGERFSGSLIQKPDGRVVARIGNVPIKPEYVDRVQVRAGCPVELIDNGILSGLYIVGATRALR